MSGGEICSKKGAVAKRAGCRDVVDRKKERSSVCVIGVQIRAPNYPFFGMSDKSTPYLHLAPTRTFPCNPIVKQAVRATQMHQTTRTFLPIIPPILCPTPFRAHIPLRYPSRPPILPPHRLPRTEREYPMDMRYVNPYLEHFTEHPWSIWTEILKRPQSRCWVHILQGMAKENELGTAG